jgi:uncharacterized protein YbjQ (UPF0145 family)
VIATTGFTVPERRVVRCLGVVRGLVVRSPDMISSIVAGLQTLIGGRIAAYTRSCEEARGQAYEIMIKNAEGLGANAVIGVRYDSGRLIEGCTEVLAYGTAVVLE